MNVICLIRNQSSNILSANFTTYTPTSTYVCTYALMLGDMFGPLRRLRVFVPIYSQIGTASSRLNDFLRGNFFFQLKCAQFEIEIYIYASVFLCAINIAVVVNVLIYLDPVQLVGWQRVSIFVYLHNRQARNLFNNTTDNEDEKMYETYFLQCSRINVIRACVNKL